MFSVLDWKGKGFWEIVLELTAGEVLIEETWVIDVSQKNNTRT